MKFIIDASVAIKWFVPEIHAIDACRILGKTDYILAAPDLIFSEFGNILWKKWCKKELDKNSVQEIFLDFKTLPLTFYSSENFLETAWAIASKFERSFYDSLYLALALESDSQLVTADSKLYNALQNSIYKKSLLWVEDIQ